MTKSNPLSTVVTRRIRLHAVAPSFSESVSLRRNRMRFMARVRFELTVSGELIRRMECLEYRWSRAGRVGWTHRLTFPTRSGRIAAGAKFTAKSSSFGVYGGIFEVDPSDRGLKAARLVDHQ